MCRFRLNVEQPTPELPAHFSTGTDRYGGVVAKIAHGQISVSTPSPRSFPVMLAHR
jgi:hypothetical protein